MLGDDRLDAALIEDALVEGHQRPTGDTEDVLHTFAIEIAQEHLDGRGCGGRAWTTHALGVLTIQHAACLSKLMASRALKPAPHACTRGNTTAKRTGVNAQRPGLRTQLLPLLLPRRVSAQRFDLRAG